jgi:hypothetical protein
MGKIETAIYQLKQENKSFSECKQGLYSAEIEANNIAIESLENYHMNDNEYQMVIDGLKLLADKFNEESYIKHEEMMQYPNDTDKQDRYDKMCKDRNDAEELRQHFVKEWRKVLSNKS